MRIGDVEKQREGRSSGNSWFRMGPRPWLGVWMEEEVCLHLRQSGGSFRMSKKKCPEGCRSRDLWFWEDTLVES